MRPFMKSTMTCPVGVGFTSPAPTGALGVHDDDRQPCLREFQDFLLGQVLRPFVVAGHLFERDGRLFRAEPSAGRKADRADGAAVDDPFGADVAGRFQQSSSCR